MNKNNYYIDINETNTNNTLPLIILSAIIGIIPMIVYMRIVSFEGIAHKIYGKVSEGDFFSYYKFVWLSILAAAGMIWFLVNRSAKPNWYHKPLVIYCFFTIISTIFSQYPTMAIWGDPCRQEGLIAHLCYMSIVFLYINLIKSKSDLKFVLIALLLSSTLLSIVGALQFAGYNYFSFEYAKQLFVPYNLQQSMPDLDLNKMNDGSSFIFLTFGNGNFTGSYMTMLFALTFALSIGIAAKWRKLLLPLNILIFVNLLGSKSRAGLYAGLAAIFLTMIFMRKQIRTNFLLVIFLLIVYAITPFVMDAYTWQTELPRLLQTSVNRPVVTKSGLFGNFESLNIENDSASFVFDGLKTKIVMKNDTLEFYDHNGEKVPYSLLPNPNLRTEQNPMASFPAKVSGEQIAISSHTIKVTSPIISSANGTIATTTETIHATRSKEYLVVFPEKKLLGFMFYVWPEQSVIEIGRGGVSFYLTYTQNGFMFLNQFCQPVDIKEVESIGFRGLEGFASNRGYIWSRSLPLLKHALFVGYGPDTFAAHFPNHDYIGKLKVWGGGIFTMIEKPHNLYLQIAINSGILSLIAVLALFFRYLLTSAKAYWKCDYSRFTEISGIAIFAAVVAYLIISIFNDSVVAVAPVFWSLLGLGIATNRINRTRNAQSN